jgi:hypothetical protein
MTADLETRARAAAAELRRAADDREPPEWSPPRRGSGPRLAVVGAVAVVGLVAIVVAGWLVLTDEDGQQVASGGDGIPELVPEVVPEGLAPADPIDLPRPESELGPERMTVLVFGDPAGTDPFAAADLGVTVFHSDAAEPAAFGEALTVRGHPAWVSTDGAGKTALMWQEAPGVLALVTSGTLDRATMTAVAEGLTFGTDPAGGDVSVGVVPPGLAQVGALHDASLTGVILPSVLPATTDGHINPYADDLGDRTLVVATLTPQPDEVPALRWMLGVDGGETTVRGHTARVATQAEGVHALLWEESPGLYVVVGGNVGADAVAAAAESLRSA